MTKDSNKYLAQKNIALVDAVDRVLEKGAYIGGDLILQIADIDLIYVSLRLVITSVSAEERRGGKRFGKKSVDPGKDEAYVKKMEGKIREIEKNINSLIAKPETQEAEAGLSKLVLTLVELIRQLMEREAIRRVETGNLTEAEIEKIGLTFKALEKKIEELKLVFGIKDDLNIDLGPLGKLL